MKNKLVSIIIPYYKKKKFFKETISSINNQKYKDYEVIVIYDDEDASELDFVKKAVLPIKKKKIIINRKNLGVGLSRNKGIKISRGNFIAFCDADDKWSPNKLFEQINFMNKKKLNFSHTSYKIIDNESKVIGSFRIDKKIYYKDLLRSCDIGLSTVVIKKKIIKNYKFSNMKTKEDYLMWLNLIKKEKVLLGVEKNISYWRKTENSLSSSLTQKIIDAYKLYHLHLKKNFFLTSFYTLRLSLYALKKKISIYK